MYLDKVRTCNQLPEFELAGGPSTLWIDHEVLEHAKYVGDRETAERRLIS